MHFTGGFEPRRLKLIATGDVAAALERIGRTEDLQFSPDGNRLAIAGFAKSFLLILDLSMDRDESSAAIHATSALEISSPNIKRPHGIFWIDDQTVIVANRGGDVSVYRLPQDHEVPASRKISLTPATRIGRTEFPSLHTPGSVSVFKRSENQFEVLVCNNYSHVLSRHILQRGNELRFVGHDVFLKGSFSVPDGIVHSPDGKWIAVSNHNHQCLSLFDSTRIMDSKTPVTASLSGFSFPHGLRFAKDGKLILVADAAEPFVHVFSTETGDWQDETRPSGSIRVMDDNMFRRGHVNPEEGGPKGIDIWKQKQVMAVTCEEVPLAFFDIAPVLEHEGAWADSLQRQRFRNYTIGDHLPLGAWWQKLRSTIGA